MRFSPFIGMIFILLIEVALKYWITNIMKLYTFPFVMAISTLLLKYKVPNFSNKLFIHNFSINFDGIKTRWKVVLHKILVDINSADCITGLISK